MHISTSHGTAAPRPSSSIVIIAVLTGLLFTEYTHDYHHVSRKRIDVAEDDRDVRSYQFPLGQEYKLLTSSSSVPSSSASAAQPSSSPSVHPTKNSSSAITPSSKKRSLEEGDQRARDFDDYVTRLKEWSKSDKSSTFYCPPLLEYLENPEIWKKRRNLMGDNSLDCRERTRRGASAGCAAEIGCCGWDTTDQE